MEWYRIKLSDPQCCSSFPHHPQKIQQKTNKNSSQTTQKINIAPIVNLIRETKNIPYYKKHYPNLKSKGQAAIHYITAKRMRESVEGKI